MHISTFVVPLISSLFLSAVNAGPVAQLSGPGLTSGLSNSGRGGSSSIFDSNVNGATQKPSISMLSVSEPIEGYDVAPGIKFDVLVSDGSGATEICTASWLQLRYGPTFNCNYQYSTPQLISFSSVEDFTIRVSSRATSQSSKIRFTKGVNLACEEDGSLGKKFCRYRLGGQRS